MKEIKPLLRARYDRKYPVAHLLGKTRDNEELFKHVERVLMLRDHMICYKPVVYNLDVYNQYAELLDSMCFQKLLECDLCVIVTADHIGQSTTNRIWQAAVLGIPVYIWNNLDDSLSEFDVDEFLNQK